MPIMTPTFNFSGQCGNAIDLYRKAFDAHIGCLLHYSDADSRDWQTPLTPEQAAFVYHAELFIGEQRVMMADHLDLDCLPGNAISLTITFDTADQVKVAYEVLKEGCTIIHPMHATTYSSCIVVLNDRFGIRWGLMTEQTEQ